MISDCLSLCLDGVLKTFYTEAIANSGYIVVYVVIDGPQLLHLRFF